jgi:hypothetical protein
MRDITQVIPGFTDPKQQPAILKMLQDYAIDMGFTPREVKEINDRKEILMVYKAMMFDRIVQDSIANKGTK